MSDGVRPLVLAPHEVRAALRGPVLIVRAVRPQPVPEADAFILAADGSGEIKFTTAVAPRVAMAVSEWLRCPLGSPRDRLWIREAWGYRCSVCTVGEPLQQHHVQYRADGTERAIDRPARDRSGLPRQRREREGEEEWDYGRYLSEYWAALRSPVTMPRWASRLTVEVKSVEVRRVSSITEEEAMAEGAAPVSCKPASLVFSTWKAQHRYRDGFRLWWEAGRRSWEDWAWFVRVRPESEP